MCGFRHEALFYTGREGFLAGTVPFLQEGVRAGEPTLVVVDAGKIAALRAELGSDAEHVMFADMAEVGVNPARIIPAWQEFVGEHELSGRPLRGIGEPIWPERTPAELVECHRHEALLNLAFDGAGDFRLLCPYDTSALDPAVVEEARRTHPILVEAGSQRTSHAYYGLDAVAAPFAEPLPEPPAPPVELAFDRETLDGARQFVARQAAAAGLDTPRVLDLVLAVNELATNSVRHGGGGGVLRLWRELDALVCEVVDGGRIEQPLAGRETPDRGQQGGYGLWLVNQLCELVQIRTLPTGSVVRMHMRWA
jgi:anti-sigma regulatory factor (Ser/Thr protein kinase)